MGKDLMPKARCWLIKKTSGPGAEEAWQALPSYMFISIENKLLEYRNAMASLAAAKTKARILVDT